MAVKTLDTSLPVAAKPYTTSSVTSQDGTIIHYRQLGQGPGLVMLHGAMESAQSHMQLAQALADSYTIYLPDRRGHNLPGPFRKNYTIQQEVDDLEALLTKTDSHYVFGVSAGGIISLQAALQSLAIHKLAVYEPALVVNHAIPLDFSRYDRDIQQGKIAAALVSGMLAGHLGPEFFNKLPRWFMEFMTRMSVRSEDKNAKSGDVTMRMLAPTLYYDFCLVNEMAEKHTTFSGIDSEVLLLGGSASPTWLKQALDALEKIIPHVQRIEFSGFNHGASSDLSATNRDSHPQEIAQAMHRFFIGK